MIEDKALSAQDDAPEDIAALYTWAGLNGTRYRDFSASRAERRESARRSALDARDSTPASPSPVQAESSIPVPSKADGEMSVEVAQLDQVPGYERAREGKRPAFQEHDVDPEAPARVIHQEPIVAEANFRTGAPLDSDWGVNVRPQRSRAGSRWTSAEARDTGIRPAWLSGEQAHSSAPETVPTPEDTLQGTREHVASRWFALKGALEDAPVAHASAPNPGFSRPPVLAVFSLAGGVGKTSLTATLGRTLAARGERVLLVDTAAFGLLPFYFGARDQRPGVLRTFTSSGAGADAPVQTLTVETLKFTSEGPAEEALAQEIWRQGREAGRVLVDLATGSGSVTRPVLRMNPTVVVPLVPDMSSVISVNAIDTFFRESGNGHLPFYVLNQFDASAALHLDLREVLRERLGDRLLPFVLHRAQTVSEALAEGMTIVDYAPHSALAEDFGKLAGWVKSLAAPASSAHRGFRWSEQ